MSWQNDDDGNKKKNPWGSSQDNGGQGPWRGYKGGEQPPDIDEVIKRAQEGFKQILPNGFGGGKIIALGLLLVISLWLATGLFIVVPGEHGVVQRFGKWHHTKAQEGLGYRFPWPIDTVTTVNVTEVRRMGIGFTEIQGRSSSQKQDIPEESLMLTSDANIVDLDMVVQWNIKSAEHYLFNIDDQENTIKKVAESAIREVVGRTRMFPIISQARTEVAQKVREIMITNLDEYQSGVNIMQVLIQQAEVHPDVQDAFQDVQSAKQDAEDVQNRAGAYREDILPKARGMAIQMQQEAEAYEQSVVARATGDAERFNSIYQAYQTGKDVTKKRIFIETMESILQNAQKIILDQKGGNGTGVVPYLPLDELKPSVNIQTPSSTTSSNQLNSQRR